VQWLRGEYADIGTVFTELSGKTSGAVCFA
jgi:hypothetical protein